MLLLPIGTDAPRKQRPTVNYALIAINCAVFLLLDVLAKAAGMGRLLELKNDWMLWPGSPLLYQFITYQFLHANWWHILGNMWFLYLFGNAVNSKMGNITYLFFYLAGGVFAGLGFSLTTQQGPILGASGAIAAVTTAYLVLYPRTTIRLFYWIFFFVGDFEIGSILMIAGKLILWDNVIAARIQTGYGHETVAYEAHLAGYTFGFAAALFMLLVHALPRDPFDIMALWGRWRRRRQFASIFAEPEFHGPVVEETGTSSGGGWAFPKARPASQVASSEIDRLREQISRSISQFNMAEAARLYREMLKEDPEQVLSRSNQARCCQPADVRRRLYPGGAGVRAVPRTVFQRHNFRTRAVSAGGDLCPAPQGI